MVIGKIDKFIIHQVGNKTNEDVLRFSEELTDFEHIEDHIKILIDNSFKSEEMYRFYFQPNLELNPVYQFISKMFNEQEDFIEQSQHIGRYLFDKSTHPQIKGGELCIVYFKDCRINNENVDCIGLFKSENKDTFIKVRATEKGYSLKDETGINTKKLDKGCLIFNYKEEAGYLISAVDGTNRNYEARYWMDEFLSITVVSNEFHQTKEFLGLTKKFVTQQLSEDFEVNKADQIDLLNRSVAYFKTNEKFEKKDFEDQVFQERDVIASFRNFDNSYRLENELEIANNFDISAQAVKKQARVFKSVLKLDKNFHIYIHGKRELIEKGVDNDGRKFYKIYYENEK